MRASNTVGSGYRVESVHEFILFPFVLSLKKSEKLLIVPPGGLIRAVPATDSRLKSVLIFQLHMRKYSKPLCGRF